MRERDDVEGELSRPSSARFGYGHQERGTARVTPSGAIERGEELGGQAHEPLTHVLDATGGAPAVDPPNGCVVGSRERFDRLRCGYVAGMKPKTMFYAGLGFVTYKAGKLFAKRKVREALTSPKSGKTK
jgi:hypothetical protein